MANIFINNYEFSKLILLLLFNIGKPSKLKKIELCFQCDRQAHNARTVTDLQNLL